MPRFFKGLGFRPQKKFSQNFLVDEKILNRILESAGVQKTDYVLEVGAGPGFLTLALAKSVKRLLAVEIDQQFSPRLTQIAEVYSNVAILHKDIMKLTVEDLRENFKISNSVADKYKIVANLPYHLTSHFLKKFLESDFSPQSLTLLLQKEVAQRIIAKPGQMSLLALGVQIYAEPSITGWVSKKAFWPEPKVDSAIINLKVRHKPFASKSEIEKIFRLAKLGFSQRRKTLCNALGSGLRVPTQEIQKKLERIGLESMVRAQELDLNDWLSLAREMDLTVRPSKEAKF